MKAVCCIIKYNDWLTHEYDSMAEGMISWQIYTLIKILNLSVRMEMQFGLKRRMVI